VRAKLHLEIQSPCAGRVHVWRVAKAIADRPGYEGYRDELHSLCDGLSEFDEIRAFVAHGSLLRSTRKGNDSSCAAALT
jgi:HEAT repeat protein